MWKYTSLFNRQNVNSLEKWLKSAKVSLADSPIKRINNNSGEKVQVRTCIYLLLCFTTADTLKNGISYLEEYQDNIKNLKKEGYSVIGYARKSKGNETE